jgi:membrane-bound lytic murein transglycosylase D
VEALFRDVRERFQGEYVFNLAPLKETVTVILPMLEGHSQTRPYASWLRTRLDYFEVTDELRLTILPPDAARAGFHARLPNPSPSAQREAWRKRLKGQPQPRGATHHVPRLKPIFAKARVPTHLVWLAEVESSFNPVAVSPMGAAGLFQLMPATAVQYGLALEPEDERFDPDRNAAVAARHLRYLIARFRDWPLALAAYNAGARRVQSVMNKHGGKSFDEIARYLPAETQLYVPKVEATLQRREGVSLASLGIVEP